MQDRLPLALPPQRMHSLRPRLSCSDGELLEIYWRFHPRFQFVKTAPAHAAMLDIGAGSGGLAQWTTWLQPIRDEIVFYGIDQQPGEHTHLYRGWESLDLDSAQPVFPGVTFDAFVLSHVIEHLRDPARMITWIASRIGPGGRVYIEWPGENAARQPGREEFLSLSLAIFVAAEDTVQRYQPRMPLVVSAAEPQGNRTSEQCEKPGEVGFIPSGAHELGAQGSFCGVLLHDVQRHVAQHGEIVRAVVETGSVLILVHDDIQPPV